MFGYVNSSGAGGVIDQMPSTDTASDHAAASARWSAHVQDMMRQDDALADSPVSPGGGSRLAVDAGGFFDQYGLYIVGGIAALVVLKVATD